MHMPIWLEGCWRFADEKYSCQCVAFPAGCVSMDGFPPFDSIGARRPGMMQQCPSITPPGLVEPHIARCRLWPHEV